MKRLVRLAQGIAFLMGTASLVAQVTVETVFEHEQYLANEPLRVGVRITNFSGQTLKLGETPEWLDLLVESEMGDIVRQFSAPSVVEAFDLPSAARATRWVDLVPHYDVGRVGRFKVTPTVRIPELEMIVTGKPAGVNITSGAKIWEQDFGVVRAEGAAGGPIEVRRYALIQSMDQKKVTLHVRVSDPQEVRVFRVMAIGPVLAFSRPEALVDRSGQLHVLNQTRARRFTYFVISPDGDVVVRQVHQYTQTRPALRPQEDGAVVVSGGYREITPDDIPTPEKAPEPVLPTPPTPIRTSIEKTNAVPEQAPGSAKPKPAKP